MLALFACSFPLPLALVQVLLSLLFCAQSGFLSSFSFLVLVTLRLFFADPHLHGLFALNLLRRFPHNDLAAR